MAFDELLDQAGTLGRFQILQIAFCFVATTITYSHTFLENFIAATPEHRCWVPLLDNHTVSHNDTGILSQDDLLRVSIPLDSNLKPEKCRRFIHPQWQLLHLNGTFPNISESDTEPCVDGWVYDRSSFLSTIVTEWDLVCDYQSQKSVVQTLFMIGSLLGSLTLGHLSDRYGRKTVYVWCVLLVAIMETCVAFAPTFIIFCILRFLAGFFIMTVLTNPYLLSIEWTVPQSQTIVATVLSCAYSSGQAILGGLAFAIRDWYTLQLVMSTPLFVISLLSRWLTESPRWLITTNKLEEATKALTRVAHINGKKNAGKILTTEFVRSTVQDELDKAKTMPSVSEILRAPKLRMRIFWISCGRLGATVPFMGLVLNLQELGSNIFMFQLLFGAITFISRWPVFLLLKYLDRRTSQLIFFFVVGSCIIINTFLSKEMQILRLILATLGVGASSAATTAFAIHCAELIPTICRSTVAGIHNLFSRTGAVLAPLLMTLVVYSPLLPWIMYGVFPMLSGLIVFCLPETRNQPFPETIQDVENSKKQSRKVKEEDASLKITQF
ncbi:steroid transmembrane transporter SLC22A24-like [Ochotona curzoniae]|uniref:steroid transmembrane transporter SLC22A24-like n=1 Tax=Ochotona curzoniae TaxID=130825 RepID=UPI001B34A9F4|nr:steroid transmembrane transporter SLC22A24-like [Ochotona curzoniae]